MKTSALVPEGGPRQATLYTERIELPARKPSRAHCLLLCPLPPMPATPTSSHGLPCVWRWGLWCQYRNLGVQRPRRCLVNAAGFLAVLAVVAAAEVYGADGQDSDDNEGDSTHDDVRLIVSTSGAIRVEPRTEAPDEDAGCRQERENQAHAHPGGGTQQRRVRCTVGYGLVALDVGVLDLAGELRVGLAVVISYCRVEVAHG